LTESINITYMQQARKILDVAEPLPGNWHHRVDFGSPSFHKDESTQSPTWVQIAFGSNAHNRTDRQMLESFIARRKETWTPGHVDSNFFTRTIGRQEFLMARASRRLKDNRQVSIQFGFARLPDGRAAAVILQTCPDSFDDATINELLAHIKGIKRSEKPVESSPLTKHFFDE
jgi:hypothetical protein